MKDLLIALLATTWVLEAVWFRGRRRHPYERPNHIDRDFREMASRVGLAPGEALSYLFDSAKQETFSNGR